MQNAKKMDNVKTSIVILLGAIIIFFGVGIIKAPTPIVLMCAAFANMFLLIFWGVDWDDIMKDVMTIAKNLYGAMILLLFVGMIVGSWIINGTIPTMIYYGLKLIAPSAFLVTATILCAIMSVKTGTSWGSLSTVGTALMGVATGLGIPAPYAAGAVIVGSYFGDHISPISDSTILAAGMAGVEVLDHVKYMLITAIPSLIISLIFFFILGRQFSGGTVESETLNTILLTLENNFNMNIILLLIPVIVLYLIYKKYPALLVFATGIIMGIISAIIFQGAPIKEILVTLLEGFSRSTGVEVVDKMLLRGGIVSTMEIVVLMMAASLFGGSFQASGAVDMLAGLIRKIVKGPKSLLVFSYIFHTVLVATLVSDFTTFSITAPILQPLFEEYGLSKVNISRMYEETGTMGSLFIPWTSASMFAVKTTGVPLTEWALYTPTVYLNIIISMIYIFTGFKIAKAETKKEMISNT